MSGGVEEAGARRSYVMAHVYNDGGIRRCLRDGVRSIEHANFASEETVAMMAESGAFFDPTFISLSQRIESASETQLSSSIVNNLTHTISRGQQVYRLSKQYNVPIAFRTDLRGPAAQQSPITH